MFEVAKETRFSFLTLDDYFFTTNVLQLLRLFVTPSFLYGEIYNRIEQSVLGYTWIQIDTNELQ